MSLPSVTQQPLTLPLHTFGGPPTSTTSSTVFQQPSFVGNTPSTVLFFLALAVGVFIATLFIFFTVRYFVRSKYGLHVYPLTHRNFVASNSLLSSVLASGNNNDTAPGGSGGAASGRAPGFLSSNPTNDEIYEQLEFIREYAIRRGLTWNGRMYMSQRTRRRHRRRRRARFAKMKKLSEEEVEILFPKKTYHDWLNGGKERDHEQRDGVLQEDAAAKGLAVPEPLAEAPEEITTVVSTTTTKKERTSHDITSLGEHAGTTTTATTNTTTTTTTTSEAIELDELPPVDIPDLLDSASKPESVNDDPSEELHFTSGTCAICLEVLEGEDIVRGLICGHVFHAECLDPWLVKRRACCPMCKRDYLYKNSATATTGTSNGELTNNDTTNNDSTNDENTNNGSSPTPDATPNGEAPAANANGDASSTNNNNTNTNANEEDEDRLSVDLEALRSDPALRALIQELIPIDERVQLILRDSQYAHLNIEERATETSNRKYGTVKAIWWRLMGISKNDLFNWCVMRIYLENRDSVVAAAQAARSETPEGETAATAETPEAEQTTAETPEAPETAEATETTPDSETAQAAPGTEPLEALSEPADRNSDAQPTDAQRSIVEQRV
ncbi:uncharacterized protein CANTADRAFT_124280 [Suhomyces tanzawaensis NRRL Y-17324]|uniref:RING-type domain-containing protein n=1 Tax=Suhomyces tanzawaensis NRRL Y-17324 TaxID=984487 RepID=A0A1E4SQS1_9ASCO|nr:uncharacterized protein CANTADRAFT_124280 [Suhomyces tanzawaensis NRRL Y-17324]ODV81860.1 hypothetical protein CANTADRAFT_124280 [Suhomyces tanzawaensis NRRL Y-17324]